MASGYPPSLDICDYIAQRDESLVAVNEGLIFEDVLPLERNCDRGINMVPGNSSYRYMRNGIPDTKDSAKCVGSADARTKCQRKKLGRPVCQVPSHVSGASTRFIHNSVGNCETRVQAQGEILRE